jgi:preprotein translocase subunit SecG
MYQIVLVIHVVIAMILIVLVLMQHGKGADIAAGFGSGASNTVFGSQGTGRFLFRLTGGLALLFFITSMLLCTLLTDRYKKDKHTEAVVPQVEHLIPIPLDQQRADDTTEKK